MEWSSQQLPLFISAEFEEHMAPVLGGLASFDKTQRTLKAQSGFIGPFVDGEEFFEEGDKLTVAHD
jgi:hypothetical protein